MDVDREWYVPYWTADSNLLAAMLHPAAGRARPACGRDGWLGLDQKIGAMSS
jgi:hypothetical protein